MSPTMWRWSVDPSSNPVLVISIRVCGMRALNRPKSHRLLAVADANDDPKEHVVHVTEVLLWLKRHLQWPGVNRNPPRKPGDNRDFAYCFSGWGRPSLMRASPNLEGPHGFCARLCSNPESTSALN